MKRLLILSVLFSLLLALGQPLMACPADRAAHDCCPGGTQDPCDTGMSLPAGLACADMTLCAAPQATTAILVQAQKTFDPALPGSAAGADLPAHPLASPRAPPDPGARAADPHPDHAAVAAALTWLHTARLRR